MKCLVSGHKYIMIYLLNIPIIYLRYMNLAFCIGLGFAMP